MQFVSWFEHALRGDLGRSIVSGEPVSELILQHFGLTAAVVLVAVTLATVIAVTAGLIAAWRQDSGIDLAVVGAATVVLAVPSFWLGLVLLLLFGVKLGMVAVRRLRAIFGKRGPGRAVPGAAGRDTDDHRKRRVDSHDARELHRRICSSTM